MANRELETDVAARIDSICQAFEAACQLGEVPGVEGFLDRADEPDREALRVELLRIESEYRLGHETGSDSRSCAPSTQEAPASHEGQASDRYKTQPTPAIHGFFELTAGGQNDLNKDVIGLDSRAAPEHYRAAIEAGHCNPLSPGVGAPLLPAVFGRYQVKDVLGKGGFGVVYLGHDPELRRDVAIKVPRRDRLHSARDAAAYLSEARLVASLKHPGIVPVYDFGRTDNGLCYVVSPFVPGGNLAARLARGRLSHAEAAELVARLAEPLNYAHQNGLVHRDLKPENILIDEAGRPLLADFGLALTDEAYGRAPGIYGTVAYMSPEQARGDGHVVDARSDIYSLGVVLYEMLAGRSPYRHKQTGDLLEEIASGETRPPRQLDHTIPPELERICLKAMAKHPADRYTTAFDLAEDVRRWQSADRSENQPDVPREKARAWRSRRSVAIAVLAVALMASMAYEIMRRQWSAKDAARQRAPAGNEQPDPGQTPLVFDKTDQATGSARSEVSPEGGGTEAVAIPTTAVPLQVRSIDVEHFARTSATEAEPRGILGKQSFAPRLGDQVTIDARLSRPAYAYLVAFRPDGEVEVCFPDSDLQPPPLTDRLRYPAAGQADTRYGLSEGTGLWAFAVLASERPLPAFRDFVAKHKPDWSPQPENPGTIWWFDGQWIEHLARPNGPSGVRGKAEAALGGSKAVERAARSLRADADHEATAAVGFGVGP